MPEFTTTVSSGGLLNIPKPEEEMHGFEQGDLVTVKVVKHKKEDGEVITDNSEDNQ